MEGQWLYVDGASLTVLEIDELPSRYRGTVILHEQGKLRRYAHFETEDKQPVQRLHLRFWLLHPETAMLLDQAHAAQIKPDQEYPPEVDAVLRRRKNSLEASLKTPQGKAKIAFQKSHATDPSTLSPVEGVHTWDDFKRFARQLAPYDFMYRGQSSRLRLRTRFHRTKRKDLRFYVENDIPQVHRALSSRTNHLFNIDDPRQNGAFYNMIQHHGFPTPLLDWTYSPFVAAFFAFRSERSAGRNSNSKVRIFRFNCRAWRMVQQYQILANVLPHFSILEALAIENNRAIPQQSLSTVTNIDDIESYIQGIGARDNTTYLDCFDLDYNERTDVLSELALMGITAGTMFPGLDGACEELRARFFGYGV